MLWHIRVTLVFTGTWRVTVINVFQLHMHKDGQGTEHGHALERVCPHSVSVGNWYSSIFFPSFVAKYFKFEHVDSLIWIGHICIHPWITHKAKVSMRRGDGIRCLTFLHILEEFKRQLVPKSVLWTSAKQSRCNFQIFPYISCIVNWVAKCPWETGRDVFNFCYTQKETDETNISNYSLRVRWPQPFLDDAHP